MTRRNIHANQRCHRLGESPLRPSHPVVDCDGHWTEPAPLWAEYVRKLAGSSAAETFPAMQGTRGNAWYEMSAEEQRRRYWRPAWWGFPANKLDRATALLPALMYERLDDFGIDFALILATLGNTFDYIRDPELRKKVVVRAANLMHAEVFAPFSDRMMPAATIATNTPDEAISAA